MKRLITLSLATTSLLTLSSCCVLSPCGPSVSKRLPALPDALVVAPSPQTAPINIMPTK